MRIVVCFLAGDFGVSILVHSSVPFAMEHSSLSVKEVEELLLADLWEIFPNWPKPNHTYTHKWPLSQVNHK